MSLKLQPVKLYKLAFKNNLVMCGEENGEPQFMGSQKDQDNFKSIWKNILQNV